MRDISLVSAFDANLKRIANILMLNASFINNLGLLNGKMGVAIFFYHYSKYSGNKIYDEYAGELMDEIYSDINTNTPINFEDGLTGIGWGIQYLVKNRFIEADLEESLSEIDASLRYFYNYSTEFIEKQDNFFGLSHYHIMRLNELHPIREKTLAYIKNNKLDCLINYCEQCIYKYQSLKSTTKKPIDQLISVIWFLLESRRLGLFPTKCRKLLNEIINRIEEILVTHTSESIVTLFKNGSILEFLLKENLTGSQGVDEVFIKFSYMKVIFGSYIQDINLGSSVEELLCIINEDSYWVKILDNFKKDKLSLTGIGGLGLGLMYILNCKQC